MTADLASVPPGARVLPVLTAVSVAHAGPLAGPLADALTAGGARCAEVTFRTRRLTAEALERRLK